MKNPFIIIQLITSLLSITCFGSEIGVPVLLWQQKTDSIHFDSKSTVNQIDAKILAEDYLTSSQTIVAFVQNHLSLEQFTTEDEEQLTSVKSIFRDQSIKPTLLTDVLNPTQALDLNHFQHQKWDGIHVKNGDKVWVELPEDSLVENNQLLNQLMAEIQKNVSKNALFLITGHKNQFQSIDLDPEKLIRKPREMPTVEDSPAEGSALDSNLINIDDCLFFYTTSVTLRDITTAPKTMANFMANSSIHTGSRCWTLANNTKDQVDNKPAILHLIYVEKNESQTTELELTLYIENKGNNYFWGIDKNMSTILINKKEYPLSATEVEAEQWFGYSCSQLSLTTKLNATADDKDLRERYSVTFTNFQLQPFANPHNKKDGKNNLLFTDTFDCQVWMTLPLWMGLITLLIMFIILSMGVYFIAIVNTPDRFENPKGKPLVISAIED